MERLTRFILALLMVILITDLSAQDKKETLPANAQKEQLENPNRDSGQRQQGRKFRPEANRKRNQEQQVDLMTQIKRNEVIIAARETKIAETKLELEAQKSELKEEEVLQKERSIKAAEFRLERLKTQLEEQKKQLAEQQPRQKTTKDSTSVN